MDHAIKTLGITWSPSCDVISFILSQLEEDFETYNFTERSTLSDIAKFFDLLGWLSRATAKLKLLMQETSSAIIQRNEQLPEVLQDSYFQ